MVHESEGTAREAVKGGTGGEESGAVSRGAGKFNGGLDAFAAGGGEVNLCKAAARAGAELFRKLACRGVDVALQHGGAIAVELGVKGVDDLRVVMAEIVDAVSGEEVEDVAALSGEEGFAAALDIVGIHFEEVEQPHPLGIDVLRIGDLAGRALGNSAFTAHVLGFLTLTIVGKFCLYIAGQLRSLNRLSLWWFRD